MGFSMGSQWNSQYPTEPLGESLGHETSEDIYRCFPADVAPQGMSHHQNSLAQPNIPIPHEFWTAKAIKVLSAEMFLYDPNTNTQLKPITIALIEGVQEGWKC